MTLGRRLTWVGPLIAARLVLPAWASLALLRRLSRRAPALDRAIWRPRFAERFLGLRGPAVVEWHRRAWWGAEAGRVASHRLDRGRASEVEPLLLPIDWAPLDRALAERRGVLLVGAHVGPHRIANWAVARRCPSALLVARGRALPDEGMRIVSVGRRATREQSLAASLFALREGGIVSVAGDGRWGRQSLEMPLFGRPLQIRRGAPALARMSGAVSLPMAAFWQGDRPGVAFGEPLRPDAPPTDADAWERQWLQAWLGWLEDRLRGDPENLRMIGGFWKAFREAVA